MCWYPVTWHSVLMTSLVTSSCLLMMFCLNKTQNPRECHNWIKSWQNQQCGCAPSKESLLSTWRKIGSLATHWAQAKTLIKLDRCPGWSESSLGAQSFCWFCHEVAQFIIGSINESEHDKTNLKALQALHDTLPLCLFLLLHMFWH